MRKVRREVIKTINEFRQHAGLGIIHQDAFTNSAANEYARFLLNEEPSPESVEHFASNNHVIGDQQAIIGYSYLDDDNQPQDVTKLAEFLDAHGLLLEMQEDLDVLMNKDYTHVGVGFAADNRMVKIVELLSARPVMITSLNPEDKDIVVQGQILKPKEFGIYACRVVSKSNEDKALATAGPYNITIDPETHNFTIIFESGGEDLFFNGEPKMLEIWGKKTGIDKIVYGDTSQKKISKNDF